ncbi:MAG: flavin reductase family protein, partial [bacterium]
CRVVHDVALLGAGNALIVGEVTGVHLRDDCLVGGRFDVTRFRPVGRLGYRDYAIVREVVEVLRPGER